MTKAKEKSEIQKLRKRVKELERAVSDSRIEVLIEREYVNIMCKDFGVDRDKYKKSRCTLVGNLNTEQGIAVKKLCRFVEMTSQNFYAHKRIRARKQLDEELIVSLVLEERKLQARLGGKKLFHNLDSEFVKHGIDIGRDRFFDVLRDHNLLVKRNKRVARTTDSYHCLPLFDNIIDDLEVTAPHQVLVSDIIYIKVGDSFMYASLITDRYSRKIVGAYLGDTLESIGCQHALKQALKQLPDEANAIHHSDRGY